MVTKKDYLTAQDVAILLGVTPYTVWKWVRNGKIEGVKLPGGDVRIPRTELEKMGVKF